MYCKNRNPKLEPKDPTGWRFCGARGKAEWRHEAEAELRPGAFAPGWEVLGFTVRLRLFLRRGCLAFVLALMLGSAGFRKAFCKSGY